jgi:hypothetical protein
MGGKLGRFDKALFSLLPITPGHQPAGGIVMLNCQQLHRFILTWKRQNKE